MSSFPSAKQYIQEATEELTKPVRTANEIQIALFHLAKLQKENPVITPKMKKLINELQAEMLRFELEKKE